MLAVNSQPSLVWTRPTNRQDSVTSEAVDFGHALQVMGPYAQWDIPVIGQSYLLFRARLVPPYAFSPGTESLETRLFAPEDIPFDQVALCSV